MEPLYHRQRFMYILIVALITIINLQGGSATNKGAYMNFFRGTTNVGALGTKAGLIGGTSNDMMFYSASNDWIFYSTGERMRVQADGLVGIGTNAPAVELHINDASGLSAIRLTGGAAGADNFQIMQGVTGVTNAGFSIYDVDATATRLVIDTNGNVGIGTGTPVKKLDVRASESWDGIHIGSTAGSATAIDFARSATHANPTARIGVAEPDATHTSDMRFYTSDATGSVPNLVEKMRNRSAWSSFNWGEWSNAAKVVEWHDLRREVIC